MGKTYTIFAGVNGAGKSTLYQLQFIKPDEMRVNPDEIVQSFGDWRNTADQMKAGMTAVKMIDDAVKSGKSFNQETTLSGKMIFNTVKKAKAAGYSVNLFYVGLESAELAKERVKQRVLKGGHDIPEDLIDKRYQESLNNLKKIIPYCDGQKIYDNTKQFELVAKISQGMILWNNKECKWLSPIVELYEKAKIEKEIIRAGYKPNSKLVSHLKNLNVAFDKVITIKGLKDLYKQHDLLESDKRKLVDNAAKEFVREEQKGLKIEKCRANVNQPKI